MDSRILSIVVPAYNERESLRQLYTEIVTVMKGLDRELDLIFVDDGSTDGSWNVIKELTNEDSRVRGIRFRTNFGKAAALLAGFHSVRGSITITLDADLQDDPKEIPRFLEALEGDLDVVSGWKKVRNDPWHKVIPSRVFNWLVGWFTSVKLHDHNCGMKCYRSEVFKEIRLYGELHRLIPVLAAARGFRVGEVVIDHRPRQYGRSKYGFKRFMKGFLDLITVKFITDFGQRPQHGLGTIGLTCFGLGMLGMLYLAITWVIRYFEPQAPFEPLHNRPLLIYSVALLLFGTQLLGMGVLAELITLHRASDREIFSISERTDGKSNPTAVKEDNPSSSA